MAANYFLSQNKWLWKERHGAATPGKRAGGAILTFLTEDHEFRFGGADPHQVLQVPPVQLPAGILSYFCRNKVM